ncbi:hypothetical protein, conserved [Entamoeba dispar SAW760]|uniref:AIG1-type G domain-containing protein n=1 Tax=Entamoeba dispar (strain ATCC PRA-260 / SAW760) TaxID=370354 RepID=B0EGA0_ENTDS|nr:uncharacterized protein EDI_234320 [Entamoeba dispar SAW760]EDR26446.1 hypothetical protein, conserved [Entamoeba dispar SAW760]|eukprot:EDR26446.1 hypothetical protein, conserved [Entamoeba dispar SAW760]
MSSENTKETKILLVGNTGDGKSSLGNFILNKKNAFKVSHSPNPETKTTNGTNGEGDRSNIFVIDTPNLSDSSKMNEKFLNDMVNSIKNRKGIQAIIVVINYNDVMLSNDLKTLIEIMCNIFSFYEFWEHVCIVWTKCYCYIPQKELETHKQSKEKSYYPQLMNLIKEMTGDEESIEFPMYYVDSQPFEGKDNTRSENEIEELLKWARGLDRINVEKILRRGGPEYKAIITEEKSRREELGGNETNRVPQVKAMRREIRIGYSGKIICSEWKEICDKTEVGIKTKQETQKLYQCIVM